jgi:mannan endo-1,4-beta-mannosidase
MSRRWRVPATKKYLGLMIGAIVIIVAAVTVAAAQPWAAGPVPPLPSVRYVGVHERDAPASYYEVQQFAQDIGMQPNLVSYYSNWPDPFQTSFAESASQRGAETVVQLVPRTNAGIDVSLAGIADGKDDVYLRSFATAVREFKVPIVLSFGHEMNGSWYPWGYQHTSPETFVAAWRHIVKLFRAEGASNATWLWTVNVMANDIPSPIPSPKAWWPGGSYVNWVGIDGYYYKSSSVFASLFGPTITAVRGFTNDPILIAETGAPPAAGQTAKINDLFAGLRAYGLLGFMWFDENTEGRAWRIASPQAFAAFGKDARSWLSHK